MNSKSAQFLSDLEGDAIPFAAAPRHLAAHRPRPRFAAGNQALAVVSVQRAVLEALLATGYAPELAAGMADEIALTVPRLEQKIQAAAAVTHTDAG